MGNLALSLTLPPRALVAGSLRDSMFSSCLLLVLLVGNKTDICLMKVNANFTDAHGSASRHLKRNLHVLCQAGKAGFCNNRYFIKCWK